MGLTPRRGFVTNGARNCVDAPPAWGTLPPSSDRARREVTTMRLRLPPAFYDDHVSRYLPSGTEIRRTSRYVEVDASDEDAAEIYSDASYYADPTGGPDWPEGVGIRASARATVKAMKAQGYVDRRGQ